MHLSWLDPHKMRKMTVVGPREDGRVRRHGAGTQGHGVREDAQAPAGELYSGDISIPKIATDEPLRLECTHFVRLIAGDGDRDKVARDGARVVRALEMLTNSLDS